MPGVGFVVIQTSRPFPVFIWHTVSLREVRMSSAPATMNSANDYYLCVWVGVLICGWRNQFTRLVLIFAFSQVIAKLFVFLVAPRIFIMNLSKQGDHILRRSEVELDDGVNAIFDWHSRSIMVKDVLIEIGVVVVSMIS